MHYLIHLARLGTADIHPAGAAASEALIDALHVRDGQHLLELGCGTGGTLVRLALRADVLLVGIDKLPEMLEGARRRLRRTGSRCALIEADSATLPFPDATFDRVYAESSLGMQSAPHTRKALREASRVLRPGGRFVANEAIWTARAGESVVRAINKQAEADFGLRPASEDVWTVENWLAELRDAGLEAIAWTLLGALAGSRGRTDWQRRLRLVVSPRLLRDHLAYRRKLAAHRHRGALLESRLFVAVRPR